MDMCSFDLSFKDFSIICRVCLSKGDLSEFEKSDVIDLFQRITDIKIEPEDNMPKNVCIICIHQLENISSFINLSRCNDVRLKNILNTSIKESSIDGPNQESDALDDPEEFLDYSDEDKANIKNEIFEDSHQLTDNVGKETSTNIEYGDCKTSLRHSTKRQPSECETCGQTFNTKSKLAEHQKENSDCRTRQYKCMHCEKAFFTKFRLKLHIRSHTKEAPFECKICFKKFRHSPNLKRHDTIVHKGLKPFKCDVCGKEYSRRATKKEHMYSHSGERPYICVYCGKRFRTYSSHFTHLYCHKITKGEISENEIKAKKLESVNFSKLECTICHKGFSSKSSIFQHLQLHGEKQFLCPSCGKAFLRKHQLDDHIKIHTGEKPHVCKYCGKCFRLISGYKNHILTHTGEKPYQCKTCLRSFVQSIHLRKHMRIHSGEKPYKCSFCDKSFAHNCNLKVHTRIHTGETPYHCEICGMGFYDSSNMKKHKKGHVGVNQKQIHK